MTKARTWPNNCRVYRDEAADELQEVLDLLRPLQAEQEMTRTGILVRVGKAIDRVQSALRWLERAGAPSVPREER